MNTRFKHMRGSAIAIAVASLGAASAARAQDEEATGYTRPTNTVEIGAINIDKSSAKFGEYLGLNKSGIYGNLSFDLRGGDGFTQNESGGTTRWSLRGSNLGLSSRALEGSFEQVGQWSLGFGYDELKHNLSDSYQTPYAGSNGGNQFTLPAAGFGIASTTGAGTTVLTAGQLAAFHNLDISSTRTNSSLRASTSISRTLSLSFDINQLDQTGAKLMGFGQSNTGGTGLVKPTGEAVLILPMPTRYKTLTANLALNWTGQHGHLTAAYHVSLFRDANDRVGFVPSMATVVSGVDQSVQYMTTAPSNQLHQLSLTGGWTFGRTTRLIGGLSISRNTQDGSYVDPGLQGSSTGGLMISAMPTTSLNGKVVNSHADLKLINQSLHDLTLSAGIKYDERDNQTPSFIYGFDAIGSGHAAAYPNTPLSTRREAADLSADYRIKAGQALRLALTHDQTSRWCGSYGVSAKYPAGTNCVVATDTREDKAEASYRLHMGEGLDLRLGYSYADRTTDSDPFAIAAFLSTNGFVPPATSNTIAGQNAGDFYGFYPYFDASRTQQVFKAGVNWQAVDALTVGISAKLADDRYRSDYGVQKGNSWSANVDASYAYSPKGSLFAYVTQQHRQRDLTDIQRNSSSAAASATALNIPAFATWSNTLKDDDLTIGIGFKQSALMGGKLELAADASYSLGKAAYATVLNYTGATTGGVTCNSLNGAGAVLIGSCGDLPDVKSETSRIKLSGIYSVAKDARIQLILLHQKLSAADYYYNAYQYGSTPNSLMPTNQQPGSYKVNAVGLSYLYSFQ